MFLVKQEGENQKSFGGSPVQSEAVVIMCALAERSGYELQVIDTDADDAVVAWIGEDSGPFS